MHRKNVTKYARAKGTHEFLFIIKWIKWTTKEFYYNYQAIRNYFCGIVVMTLLDNLRIFSIFSIIS